MTDRTRVTCLTAAVAIAAGLLLADFVWLMPRPSTSSVQQQAVDTKAVAIQPAQRSKSVTKWKLEFPRFYLPIEDLAARIHQRDVPVFKGVVQFLGQWPADPPKRGQVDMVPIKAQYGTRWDGFYLGYELTASVDATLFGKTRLSVSDLKDVHIRYTDDRLEAEAQRAVPTDDLIDQLALPENRMPEQFGSVVPGGEMLTFSRPLKVLMFRGAPARRRLLARLDDAAVRNEVVLALGAIGDEATVPELISRYPRGPIKAGDRADTLTRVCFSFALSWLTGECIDRSRFGTDLNPGDAQKWQTWWIANEKSFRVRAEKPYATWVPPYPTLTDGHVARIQKMFAERGNTGFIAYE